MNTTISDNRRRSILLWGWFGQSNSGDDALLTMISDALARTDFPTRATTFVEPYSPLPPLLSDLLPLRLRRIVRGDCLPKHLVALSRSDAVVWGGGSLMSDADKRRMFDLRYMRFVVQAAGLLRVPVILAALGVGPFRTSAGEAVARHILNGASLVQVRDSASARLCRELGTSTPVVQGFDPAVLIPEALGLSLARDRPATRERLRIGIALSNSPGTVRNGAGEPASKIRHLVDGLKLGKRQADLQVTAIQMCANSRADDMSLCHHLITALQGVCQVSLIRYHPDPGAMLQKFAELDVVIAERLHAGVYAYTMNIPLAVIPYHEKCQSFADDIGLPSAGVFGPLPSPEEVDAFITAAATCPHHLQPSLPLAAARQLARRGRTAVVTSLNECLSFKAGAGAAAAA